MNQALPDVVGIGALKAGTTFLDRPLRPHPPLSLPRFIKDAGYFSAHYQRGLGWYASLFDPPDERLRGEISPQYMTHPRAVQRLWETNPETRILATLRNPVARTISQYRHWVQETGYPHAFETFLRDHPNAVARSEYHCALRPWIGRFGRDRVELVVFDDLIAEPADSGTPANVTFSPRFAHAYALAKRASNRLRANRGARVVHGAKRLGLDRMFRAGAIMNDVGSVTKEQRDRLADRLRPDIERLSELMNRDFINEWFLSPT